MRTPLRAIQPIWGVAGGGQSIAESLRCEPLEPLKGPGLAAATARPSRPSDRRCGGRREAARVGRERQRVDAHGAAGRTARGRTGSPSRAMPTCSSLCGEMHEHEIGGALYAPAVRVCPRAAAPAWCAAGEFRTGGGIDRKTAAVESARGRAAVAIRLADHATARVRPGRELGSMRAGAAAGGSPAAARRPRRCRVAHRRVRRGAARGASHQRGGRAGPRRLTGYLRRATPRGGPRGPLGVPQ